MNSSWGTIFEAGPRNVHFCSDCGSLLSNPDPSGNVICPVCNASTTLDVSHMKPVVMKSITIARKAAMSRPFVKPEKGPDTSATVKEDCPKCGNHELRYKTAQLRSADEGQTIFYECPACSFKYSVNS